MTIQENGFLNENISVGGSVGLARPTTGRFYRDVGKRFLDVVLVIAAAPVVLPVSLLLAALIACDGHNPFYRQARIGRNGRRFMIWKLRTMVPDAEAALERHLASDTDARREWDEKQKLTCDPRVTRLGAVIRKTSLDELPQLWNVLVGDMSLVGPRPMMPDQQKLYPGRAYFALRPGVTGFWQISDRNRSSFAARAEYDARYDSAVSFWTDLGVIARTIPVVLRGTGC